MTDRYFSIDSEACFQTHATAEEARAAAEEALDDERDRSGDGWSEEVEQIAWGVIVQTATQVDRVTLEEAEAAGHEMVGTLRANGWDYHCGYELRPELPEGDLPDVVAGALALSEVAAVLAEAGWRPDDSPRPTEPLRPQEIPGLVRMVLDRVAELKREESTLRAALEQASDERGEATFVLGTVSKPFRIIVTGPADREQDMAKMLAHYFAAINLVAVHLATKEEIERLRSALSALVHLKDEVKAADPAAYERRKPAAWAEARAALGVTRG